MVGKREIAIEFRHRQTTHCESGVVANLMHHRGLPVSEALVFGMGGGLFFGYFPFMSINGLPLTIYRSASGSILKRVSRNVGFTVRQERFANRERAMAALDAALEINQPVGLQTSLSSLPYLPRSLRFHYTAHNLVVYGRKGENYLISDPLLPAPVVCPGEDLAEARYVKGRFSPRGRMYYLEQIPDYAEYSRGILDGIGHVCSMMLRTPLPFIGTSGIRFLAARMRKWPERLGMEKASLILEQIVRMQEEIGTGGAGFRFIYADFLEEAAGIFNNYLLQNCSRRLNDTAERWSEFAGIADRICNKRAGLEDSYENMASILEDCARREIRVYQELLTFPG